MDGFTGEEANEDWTILINIGSTAEYIQASNWIWTPQCVTDGSKYW